MQSKLSSFSWTGIQKQTESIWIYTFDVFAYLVLKVWKEKARWIISLVFILISTKLYNICSVSCDFRWGCEIL